MFFYAMDADLLRKNVFCKLPRSDRRGNNVMLSQAISDQVLAHIRGTENRLVFGLSRWAGLRTISEHRRLRWGDVNWETHKCSCTHQKPSDTNGKESRAIPIFPEVAKLLAERFEDAAEGEEYILPSYRLASSRKATGMFVARSGVLAWTRGLACGTAYERRGKAS